MGTPLRYEKALRNWLGDITEALKTRGMDEGNGKL